MYSSAYLHDEVETVGPQQTPRRGASAAGHECWTAAGRVAQAVAKYVICDNLRIGELVSETQE